MYMKKNVIIINIKINSMLLIFKNYISLELFMFYFSIKLQVLSVYWHYFNCFILNENNYAV
jgi:hypothetical protein